MCLFLVQLHDVVMGLEWGTRLRARRQNSRKQRQARRKQMKTKLFSFAFSSFSESGLFNRLRLIQIEKISPRSAAGSRPRRGIDPAPGTGYSTNSDFRKEFVRFPSAAAAMRSGRRGLSRKPGLKPGHRRQNDAKTDFHDSASCSRRAAARIRPWGRRFWRVRRPRPLRFGGKAGSRSRKRAFLRRSLEVSGSSAQAFRQWSFPR